MGTASQAIADLVEGLRPEDPPEAVRAAAARHVLDAIGVALAGSSSPVVAPLVDVARSWAGATESTVIGHGVKVPAAVAALLNGAAMHALHFDDTHVESVIHPSSVVVSAALAVGEEIDASGAEVLLATIAGYEVAARVGAAAPGRFQARGLDTTGVCGTFGAATAAAKLWGLTAGEIAAALGIAGMGSAGVLASATAGAIGTRLQPGWAAHTGVLAADLARRGAEGPLEIFDGPAGLFRAMLRGESVDGERITRGLGSEWETTRIAINPYPASDFLQAFIDAGRRATVRWADIEEIVCSIAPAAVDVVAEPRAPRLHPETTPAAQFSLPFAVASAIVGGRDALELFEEEARQDRRVLTLAERVHHRPDPTAGFPRSYGGAIEVHTRAGRTLTFAEDVNRGHPDRPLSESELREKFLRNAAGRLGEERARAALQDMLAIGAALSVERLTASVRTPA